MKKLSPRRFAAIVSAAFLGLAIFAFPSRQANAGGFSFSLNTGSTAIGIGVGDGGSGLYVGSYPAIGYVEPAPMPAPRFAPPPRPMPAPRFAPPAPTHRGGAPMHSHGMRSAPAPKRYPSSAYARDFGPSPRDFGPAPTPGRSPMPGGPRTQPGGPRR